MHHNTTYVTRDFFLNVKVYYHTLANNTLTLTEWKTHAAKFTQHNTKWIMAFIPLSMNKISGTLSINLNNIKRLAPNNFAKFIDSQAWRTSCWQILPSLSAWSSTDCYCIAIFSYQCSSVISITIPQNCPGISWWLFSWRNKKMNFRVVSVKKNLGWALKSTPQATVPRNLTCCFVTSWRNTPGLVNCWKLYIT